jgi:hypothetical protein
MDGAYIQSVQKQYGSYALNTFPNLWLSDFMRWVSLKGIKRIRPLYYVDYVKKDVKELLTNKLGWKAYGGHHLENLYTKFIITYFLPERYNIDMRMLGYSALIRSGQLSRSDGLRLLEQPQQVDPSLLGMVENRLGLSLDEVLKRPRKTYRDYDTYSQIFKKLKWFWWTMYKLGRVPKSFYLKYT